MYIRQCHKQNIYDWLRSPIETKDGVVYDDSRKPITHANFVNSVCNDIIKIT